MSGGTASPARHSARRPPAPSPAADVPARGRRTTLPLGARILDDGRTTFNVWAPTVERLRLRLHGPSARTLDMTRDADGYHSAAAEDLAPGTRYAFIHPDGTELPDPASRFQPDGVHGPSAVVPTSFDWRTSSWRAPNLRELVLYELHVGTFTSEGTFDAAASRLTELLDLGITAVELMPVAQFPGARNWGYDGVLPFATQNSYGGPDGLKRFVDAAHALDLWVVLDVVYNHLGPEGNYLSRYGPYFTDAYRTPWGSALNFDGPGSDHVRRYFIESALQWTDEFRVDGLRLDAIHAIHDRSARPFLRELADTVRAAARRTDREVLLIAESDLGDPRVMRPAALGGLGLDAQWLDDFHHSLRTLLTGDSAGYYADFGTLAHLARAYQHGFVYAGEYSRYRDRSHGAPAPDILPRQFIVYSRNHDQIGNRMMGDRLSANVTPAQLRLAAAAVILSPFTPLLFMGEEYATARPFPFFVEMGDPDLVEAVRRGRREEFAAFGWRGEPPDPQSAETFRSAVLDWNERTSSDHAAVLTLYRRLFGLRRDEPALRASDTIATETCGTDGSPTDGAGRHGVVAVRRRAAGQTALLLLNFASEPADYDVPPAHTWRIALDTGAAPEGTPCGTINPANERIRLAAHSAVLLLHDED